MKSGKEAEIWESPEYIGRDDGECGVEKGKVRDRVFGVRGKVSISMMRQSERAVYRTLRYGQCGGDDWALVVKGF
ncbi:hypothetical protein CEXT_725501 [Caerostris extrusa]|uniref:Uncharacterized protein n=1 Tax=Caerostris extrusa TaxID=172846 RepID=A0AAV4Y7Z7_CAEEX|nr:hypothetical protein CEXT_725501 [Caerostris extrusa]